VRDQRKREIEIRISGFKEKKREIKIQKDQKTKKVKKWDWSNREIEKS